MCDFEFEFRHRSTPNESLNDRHANFINVISKLNIPWNLKELKALPDIGSDLTLTLSLSGVLGKGINGKLVYIYKGYEYLQDNAQYDDNIFIEFNLNKVDVETIINIFKVYIVAFDCYRASVNNIDVSSEDWDGIVEECNSTGKDVNGRDGIYRINAINFFDRELCLRAFNLSPEQIIERLEGDVESVSLLHDGVLLIDRSNFLESDEFEKIDSKIRSLLA